jgi:hypothetical protein
MADCEQYPQSSWQAPLFAFKQHLQADRLAEVALTDRERRLQQFQQSGVRCLQYGEGFLVGEYFVPQGLVGQDREVSHARYSSKRQIEP